MAKKLTFTLSADVVADATAGILVGEFNNWDIESGISLKKQKDGTMKTSLELEGGKSYQYRYLLNDGRWVNDENAAHYAHAHGFEVENCVITVPAEAEVKTSKAKAPKEAKPAKAKETKPAKEKVTKPAKAAAVKTEKAKPAKEDAIIAKTSKPKPAEESLK